MGLLDIIFKKKTPTTDELIQKFNELLDIMYPEENIVNNYIIDAGGKSGEGYVVYSMFRGNMYFNDMEYGKQHLTICGIDFRLSTSQPQTNPICLEEQTISHDYIYFRFFQKTKEMGYSYETGENEDGKTASLTVWKS